MSEQPTFFARRRAGLKAEREAEQAIVAPDIDEDAEEPDLTDMSDAEILELLKLPDPDTLRKGDNFAAFMAKAVPLHLRNRALRKLWRSDPVLACLDGLNDYDADYLTGSTGQGVIQTSYQVGKGLLAHVEKLAAEVAAQDDGSIIEQPGDPIDTVALTEDPAPEVTEAASPEADDTDDTDHAEAPDTPPRRMRFAFGDRA